LQTAFDASVTTREEGGTAVASVTTREEGGTAVASVTTREEGGTAVEVDSAIGEAANYVVTPPTTGVVRLGADAAVSEDEEGSLEEELIHLNLTSLPPPTPSLFGFSVREVPESCVTSEECFFHTTEYQLQFCIVEVSWGNDRK
jgi:hypothetical protein